MEAIITIVGFLGAGKTTLLKHLTNSYIAKDWNPYIILNDYENANLDAVQLTESLNSQWVKALTGSCICCSGINELRDFVNGIPERKKGITLIEANGTSDACSLMEFLGVGIIADLKKHNPYVQIVTMDALDISFLPELSPSKNTVEKIAHQKAHWASCSTDLPNLPNIDCIYDICKNLPKSLLRVKGCTIIADDKKYIYFERTPDGKVFTRLFNGVPTTGAKLLSIGPGSDIELLNEVINQSITNIKQVNN